MDLQNLFCGYIWHPVQKSGWFLVDAAVDEKVHALVDGIGYAIGYVGGDKNMHDIVNAIMNTIVNAAMDTFGDAAVSAVVDALMHAIGG